jgi:ribosome-associated protein
MAATPYELARVAAIAADDKKATDIVLLDLENDSDVCEYFLIFSAPNTRLLDAIIDEIRDKMKKTLNIGPLSQEGRAGASWVLLDYGSLVVHGFLPETRDFYRLERLWGSAPRIDLGLEGQAPIENVALSVEE